MAKSESKPTAPLFLTEEVLKATGTSQAGLKEYLRLKFIRPFNPSTGKRQRHQFNFENLMQIRLIRALSEAGVARAYILPISNALSDLELPPIRDPFSLAFLTDFQPEKKYSHTISVFFEVQHYGTFFKVGWRVLGEFPGNENVSSGLLSDYLYKLVRVGKAQKIISRLDLSESEKMKMDTDPVLVQLKTNGLHAEIKERLMSMGLL